MKRKLLSMLLTLFLLTVIMTSAAWADDTLRGTVVLYREGPQTGYIYDGSEFLAFEAADMAAVTDFQVGQSVSFTMTEDAITDGSLTVTDSTPMSLSVSGGECVDDALTITVDKMPDAGSGRIQLYRADSEETRLATDKIFSVKTLPEGSSYTISKEDINKYISVKLDYCVNIGGTDYHTMLTYEAANRVPGGSCGDSLTWYLTKAGSGYGLNIIGRGAMTNYDTGDSQAPWMAYSGSINALSLPKNLTALGSYAFQGCEGISTVTLPAAITSVGAGAFGRGSGNISIYSLAGSTDAPPDWTNSRYLTSTDALGTVYLLTHHSAAAATCGTDGNAEYYAFDGSPMASTYYDAQKAVLTESPIIPATGLHTIGGDGSCTVCGTTCRAGVQVGTGAVVGYESLEDALEAANGDTGSETVTVTALAPSEFSIDTPLTRSTGAIVLDLGGCIVDEGSSVLTINGADVTVKNGSLQGSGTEVILVSSGKLKLESGLCLRNINTIDVETDRPTLTITGGTVTVNGAAFINDSSGGTVLYQDGGTLVVNSGDFRQTVKIKGGSATLKGGIYFCIKTYGGSVADILGENCAYKYVSTSTWESEPAALSEIIGVTVEAAPVRVTDFTISESRVDSDYAAGPVLSVTAEKTNAADAGEISYRWEYSCPTFAGFITGGAVTNDSVSSFALKTGLSVDTYQFRCRVSLGDVYEMTTEPVTLEVVMVHVAAIGDAKYASFNAALEYSDLDGRVITLMKDTSFNGTEPWVIDSKTVTLDLNGYTLNFGSKPIEVRSTIKTATLNVTDGSESKSGRLIASEPLVDTPAFIQVAGAFALQAGNIECTHGVALYSAAGGAASIVIRGGSITGSDAAIKMSPSPDGSLTVSGGTFTATEAAGTALLTGVTTKLTGGTFINSEGGGTIADCGDDERAVSGFLESGYSYYPDDGTGAALDTDENTTISQKVTVAKTRVTTLDLTGLITAPVVGATPQSTVVSPSDFTVTGISWGTVPDNKFALSGIYTATLDIQPAANYSLEGISETAGFSHSGASSVTLNNSDGVYSISIVFPAVTAPTFVFATAMQSAGVTGAFQIGGVPFNTATMADGVNLGTTASRFATTYTGSGGAYPYPTGMKTFAMESTDNGFTVNALPVLDNALQYRGCSIRTVGVKGIRMITGIPDELRAKLLRAELDGYKLLEYGTVVAFKDEMAGERLTLDDSYAKHNYAYKRGVSDAVFGKADNLTQYTNVLTNFTLEQCKKEIGMRPYMILENDKGATQTLYGGIVYRSIGYIAWQNRNTYEAGTVEYRYIHEIIDYVYGENTPTE